VFGTSFAVSASSDSGLAVDIAAAGGCSINAAGDTVTMTSGSTDCVLTASQGGNANYNAATGVERTVVANKANQVITFAQPASPKVFGSSFAVSASSDSGLAVDIAAAGGCSINAAGDTVTMTSGSTDCVLTASQGGNANYNAATDVERTVVANKANQVITFAQPASPKVLGTSFAVSASSDSGLAVDIAAAGGCSINAAGDTVTMTSGSTDCVLTASQGGNANYNAATDVMRTVVANKADQTITFGTIAAKTFGDADFNLTASASSGLSVSFSATGDCTVVAGPKAHITGAGSCTITASQAGNANYKTAANG